MASNYRGGLLATDGMLSCSWLVPLSANQTCRVYLTAGAKPVTFSTSPSATVIAAALQFAT